MPEVQLFATLMLIVQLLHSVEELSTGFHKKWYLFKMNFKLFLSFEIVHNLFWTAVIFIPSFPNREVIMAFFIPLMFANGVQHLVWAGSVKKYVPGLITAPIHILLFLILYYNVLF